MGFRDKLLDFKKRLSEKKMYSIVVVIIGAVSIFGIYQYKHVMSLRQELDNQYNRAFYDMVGYVHNVDVLLAKSIISSSPSKTASTLQEAWHQANLAQTNLGQLPVSQQVLANTSKFLSQVGDLSYSLNNQNLSGKPLTTEQYKMIEQLQTFAVTLGNNLNDLENQISSGRLKWGELADKGTPLFQKTSAKMPSAEFESIDKSFQNYPTFIYDGPFSDHLNKEEAKGVSGEQLNEEQAKTGVVNFFGADKIKEIVYTRKNDLGPINTYSYKVTFKNAQDKQEAQIDITQKGGHVFWMIYDRSINKNGIKIDEAKDLGKKFLESRGYPDMVDTYYLLEDNTATINYAFKQGNVTIYPDLIKLKIALDNGEIVGFEAKAYLSSHTVRTIPKPKISEQQARALISSNVKVISSDLAIIPTDFKTELFTYEFKGKLNNRDFLVYINTQTGKEENILMIIDTPNGVLTM